MTLNDLVIDYLYEQGLPCDPWTTGVIPPKGYTVHVERCYPYVSAFYIEIYAGSVHLSYDLGDLPYPPKQDRTVNMADPNSLKFLEEKIREVIMQMKNITTDREAKTQVCSNKETIL